MNRIHIGALAIVGLAAGCGPLALPGPTEQDPKDARAEAERKAAEAKAADLDGVADTVLVEPKSEEFAVEFPGNPERHGITLVGLNPDFDVFYDLKFHNETTFEMGRYRTGSGRDDREYLNASLKRHLDHNLAWTRGKPEEWVIKNRREFIYQGYPALEIEFTYQKSLIRAPAIKAKRDTEYEKKYTKLFDRAGRYRLIKLPKDLIVISVIGEPDVVAAPVAKKFFASLEIKPKSKR